MDNSRKISFFDGIADKWDGWEDLDEVRRNLTEGLKELGLAPDEAVLDVGCGTGNLTGALLELLSPSSRVFAVDYSPRMVEMARRKIQDPRVTWHACDVTDLPLADGSLDRIVCFSVWPHFDDAEAVLRKFMALLRPGGWLHVWHLASRDKINDIHANAGEAVAGDILIPAAELAQLITDAGFDPTQTLDDESRYLVTARKGEASA